MNSDDKIKFYNQELIRLRKEMSRELQQSKMSDIPIVQDHYQK